MRRAVVNHKLAGLQKTLVFWTITQTTKTPPKTQVFGGVFQYPFLDAKAIFGIPIYNHDMAQQVRDKQGKLFRAGASARLHNFPVGGPLSMPYLWDIIDDAGTLYIESRPAGDVRLLTEDLAKQLIVFEEPSFLRPEQHAEIWNEILAMGWVVSAERLRTPEYTLFARRVIGDTLAASPLITMAEFHLAGSPDEYRARIFWRALLSQLKNPPKNLRK